MTSSHNETHTTRPGCCSRFRLERFLAEELEGDAQSHVASHVATCHDCQARLVALQQEQATFETVVPFEAFLGGIEQRLERPPVTDREPASGRILYRLWFWLRQGKGTWLAGVAATALALVALPTLLVPDEPLSVRVKGVEDTLPISVMRLSEGTISPALSGETFKEGDQLQLTLKPSGMRFAQIFSLDELGHISRYYPSQGEEPLPLPSDSPLALPGSIRLDDYVGLERLFVVASRDALPFSKIKDAVEASQSREGFSVSAVDSLPIPGTRQASVFWVKEKRP